jgi:hypothetical protein
MQRGIYTFSFIFFAAAQSHIQFISKVLGIYTKPITLLLGTECVKHEKTECVKHEKTECANHKK